MLFSAGGEPEIVRFAEEVARKLRFTGHRAFDFTPPSGDLYVLERNPRATAGCTCCRQRS